jgi:N-acetylneuraminic acid mutarotase
MIVLACFMVNFQDVKAASENTWQTMQSLPEPLAGHAVVVDGKIYIFQAIDKNTCLFEYDPQNQTLTQKRSMPTHRTSYGLAVVDHKIYTIGGQGPPEPGPTKVTEAYNTKTGIWETKQPAIDYSSSLTASTIGGKIYAMYGGGIFDGSTMISTGSNIDVYDPQTDTWTRKSSIPNGILGIRRHSCVIDNKIFVLQDQEGAKMNVYNPTTNSWSSAASPPTVYSTSRMVATAGVYAPKQIYLVGGAIVHGLGNFTSVNAVFSYDPVSDSWSTAANMPTARSNCAVAVVNDKIYALGGTLNLTPYDVG